MDGNGQAAEDHAQIGWVTNVGVRAFFDGYLAAVLLDPDKTGEEGVRPHGIPDQGGTSRHHQQREKRGPEGNGMGPTEPLVEARQDEREKGEDNDLQENGGLIPGLRFFCRSPAFLEQFRHLGIEAKVIALIARFLDTEIIIDGAVRCLCGDIEGISLYKVPHSGPDNISLEKEDIYLCLDDALALTRWAKCIELYQQGSDNKSALAEFKLFREELNFPVLQTVSSCYISAILAWLEEKKFAFTEFNRFFELYHQYNNWGICITFLLL